MRYFEKRLAEDERVILAAQLGLEGAAKELGVSKEELSESLAMFRFQIDPELFAKRCLKILDKLGQIVPLEFNRGQKKIMLSREKQLLAGVPVRQVLLKARQFGGSTFAEAEVYRDILLNQGRSAMIIAHDLDSARHLREMSLRFHQQVNIPHVNLKKETDKWWRMLHRFKGNQRDSSLRIDTAEELSTGHSLTLHHLHLCLAPDTPILVEHGRQKLIKDLKVGDRLLTHNGNYARVSFISKKLWDELPDLGETVIIKPWMGVEAEMTPQHKVFTNRGWIQAGELTKDDLLAMPVRKITNRIKSLPVDIAFRGRKQGGGTRRVGNDTFPLNKETGYFVGYYLAEGCNSKDRIGNPSTFTFSFCGDGKEIEYARRAVSAASPWMKSLEYGQREGTKTETLRFTNCGLAEMVDECFGSKDEKHIPDWVFDCGEDFCRGIVLGYLHGDGSKTIRQHKDGYMQQSICASSIRESLTYQIRDLVASLYGGWGSIYEREAGEFYGRNCKKQWTVIFNGETAHKLRLDLNLPMDKLSEIGKRANKFSVSDGKIWIRIKEISKGFVSEVYDIEVDHEDHSFRTPSFSVSNSEIQNWRDASTLVKGLFPTVPNHPMTTIFMEGTGSGVGDYWYDFCQMAMSPDSGWEFVFVAWYEIEDYTLPFKNMDERMDFGAKLDSEEKVLRDNAVTLEQLHWRRRKIAGDYKGDIDSFRQQYPSNPDEAFLTSGRPVFPPIKVKERMLDWRPPLKIGNIGFKNNKPFFWEIERGHWEIWEEPELGVENLYVMGVDVAEGIAVVPELGNRGGDFSCAKILRRDTRKFVARCHERLDPDLFAKEILAGASYFGNCAVLIENNPGGSGNVVIRDLKDKRIHLLKTVTLDRIHDVRKEQFGWDTNKESKREMIDELGENIREDRFFDPSKNFWFEASTYIRDDKGRTNAQLRKYDDEVIANALAFQGDKLLPMVFRLSKKEKRRIARDMDVPQTSSKGLTQAEVMERTYVD